MTEDLNTNSVIIGCERVDLTPYLSSLDEDNYIISMTSLGFTTKIVNDLKGKFYNPEYAILPKGKKYAIRFPEKRLYTNEEGREFVNVMMNRSNFAKANKILRILYRQENKPCGVLTEEF